MASAVMRGPSSLYKSEALSSSYVLQPSDVYQAVFHLPGLSQTIRRLNTGQVSDATAALARRLEFALALTGLRLPTTDSSGQRRSHRLVA